jgi:DNA-binding IclR family transcriptional regulator
MAKEKKQEIPKEAKVKSLYKAMQILFLFSEENDELGVTEIAEKSGLLKSTVHNILSTFEACNIVKRDSRTNKFRLGIRVLELSNQFYHNNDIRQVMRPILEQVANDENETVYLAVLQDTEVIYIDAAFPSSNTGGRNMTGIKAPTYCTGIGKAMLAFEPDKVTEQVIREGFQQFTANTVSDGKQLKKELEEIRKKGYAIDNMEHEYGVKCVAVPITDHDGKVVAAVSVSGPSPRFDKKRIEGLADSLKEKVRQISYRL